MVNTNYSQIDLGWEIKYSNWETIEKSNQETNTNSNQVETNPIFEEEEIQQIIQLAQLLGSKGYEFILNLEPRDSYKKILITKQYSDGPYRISVSNKFLKPLELKTYGNFEQVVQACEKNKIGLLSKYNPLNMLIYKSEGKHYLGFRCHKCDSFKSSGYSNKSKPFDMASVNIEDYMEIPSPYYVNRDIFCSDCRKAGLTYEEMAYSHEIEQVLCHKVNEKSLQLEYSSGGSVSMIYSLGHIYKI